jgi:hypothetical protein
MKYKVLGISLGLLIVVGLFTLSVQHYDQVQAKAYRGPSKQQIMLSVDQKNLTTESNEVSVLTAAKTALCNYIATIKGAVKPVQCQ